VEDYRCGGLSIGFKWRCRIRREWADQICTVKKGHAVLGNTKIILEMTKVMRNSSS
jgi:hypothetical protein